MMEASRFFIAVILALATTEDGVLSCTIPSHKISSPPCTSSDSDPTSDSHHTSVPCRSSHGKHRNPLNKNEGHSLDSTSIPHHKFISRPHTIPPTSPCDSSSGSSSCLPKVLLGLPNGSVSPKPLFIPATPTSDSTSVLPSTPFAPSGYNPDLLKYLMKVCLSSPACNNASKPQLPSESQNVLPTSNATPMPVRVPKPHTISCISSPGSSNVLPNIPCGSTPSYPVTPNPKLLFPVTVSPSVVTPDLKTFLHNIFSWSPVIPALPGCNSTPSSPLCPSIRPTLNKDAVPVQVSKPSSKSYPNYPLPGPSSCSSSTPPGLPCVSSSPSNITVPKSDSETALSQTSKVVTDHVPEEFPGSVPAHVPSPGSETRPVQPSTGQNSTSIHNSHKLVLPPQLNIKSIPIHKSHVLLPPCGIPLASKSCVSNNQKKMLNDSHLPNNITFVSVKHPFPYPFSVPSVPSLSPGVSSGYNPAYMNQLIRYLLSTSPGVQPLSSSAQDSQPLINITPVSPASLNPLPVASNNSNEILAELKPPSVSLLNTSSTNLSLASTINSNITNTTNVPNNPILTNILCKLLLSTLIASKTPFHPCLPPPMSPLNTNSVSPIVPNPLPSSLPFQSTFDSFFDLLNTIPNPIISSSNMSSPSKPLIPLTPLPIQKPLLEPFQSKIPSTLTSTPLLGCHHKHLPPQQPGVNPCLHKAIRPHTPSPALSCLHLASKLNSRCKHLS